MIGAALDSSQSLLFPILVYASVQKFLGKKLEYPSDLQAWFAPQSLSNAVLNSHQYEWMALVTRTPPTRPSIHTMLASSHGARCGRDWRNTSIFLTLVQRQRTYGQWREKGHEG